MDFKAIVELHLLNSCLEFDPGNIT